MFPGSDLPILRPVLVGRLCSFRDGLPVKSSENCHPRVGAVRVYSPYRPNSAFGGAWCTPPNFSACCWVYCGFDSRRFHHTTEYALLRRIEYRATPTLTGRRTVSLADRLARIERKPQSWAEWLISLNPEDRKALDAAGRDWTISNAALLREIEAAGGPRSKDSLSKWRAQFR